MGRTRRMQRMELPGKRKRRRLIVMEVYGCEERGSNGEGQSVVATLDGRSLKKKLKHISTFPCKI